MIRKILLTSGTLLSLWGAGLFGLAVGMANEAEVEPPPQLYIPLELEGGFVAGTLVRTNEGLVPIESVEAGERVISCEQETQVCVERVVEATFSHYTDAMVRLSVSTVGEDDLEIVMAADHRLARRSDGSWLKAKDLEPTSDRLQNTYGEEVEIRAVQSFAENTLIYNLLVDGLHNYHVSTAEILVHNFNPLAWVSENVFHNTLTNATFLAGLGSFISLMLVKAPYGRHITDGWGKTIPNKLGWILMEIPSVVAFATTFALGQASGKIAPQVLAGIWLAHYIYRTFIYPQLIRTTDKKMPLSVALTGFSYNIVNSYLNARQISQIGNYPNEWLKDPRFLTGALIFALGFAANVHSDHILINLRQPGETGYKIPEGGLFKFVSSPNYLGEMLEWIGWSIASWSKPGLSFALYTASNLVPRALANHKWYEEKFKDDYPAKRTAIIPGIL